MEPFKNLINAGTVEAIARQLRRADASFASARFRTLALTGLEALEFKARAQHVCAALCATLPADFARAAEMIEASLAPMNSDDTPRASSRSSGLAGWAVWPLCEVVATRGLDDPARALRCLHALTQRHTAEWSIRPFIERHPALAFATLATWATDPSGHVRRLVSEGSRPRLPWGLQLKGLIADPAPTLPLLLALQDDPSDYVRRSVANHLNDIAKDHPGVVVQWVTRHLSDASDHRRALLRHASRTLIKRGDPAMLKAWGLGQRLRGSAQIALSASRIRVGDSFSLCVTLNSSAARAQKLVIDYAVHHVKANGDTSAKVFKGWGIDLAARETRTLVKTHSMRVITTRRYHAGAHAVDLRVNGEVLASAPFELTLAD